MTPCPDRETFAAYLDRRLDPSDRDGLEAHLAACPSCRNEIVALSSLLGRIGTSDPVASPAFLSRLRMLVRRPAKRRAAAVVAGLAAAALLAIGLIVWQSKGSELAPPPPVQAYRPAGPIAPSPAPSPEQPKRTPPPPTADPIPEPPPKPAPQRAPPVPPEPVPPGPVPTPT